VVHVQLVAQCFLIEALNKPMNTPCQYVTDKGCSVYNSCTKPQTCTEFMCAYLEGKGIPEELRPDKCGIIFIKHTDRIFSGILIPNNNITIMAKRQIESFNQQGYSVILLSVYEKDPYIKLGINHNKDDIIKEYEDFLNGNIQH